MPQFPTGPLFGSARYAVLRGRPDSAGWEHDCRVSFPAVPPTRPDEELVAEVRSINYRGTFDSNVDGTFDAFVRRRRAELRREMELLAAYHGVTAHVPQVLDWVEGRNEWDPEVANAGLADGEPALVVRRVKADPLTALKEPLSVDEGVRLLDQLLRVLRVFHATKYVDPPEFPAHYFVTLSPDDVLYDRATGGVWFRNLWKLRAVADIKAGRIPCDEQLRGFVSPAAWPRLLPPAAGAAPPGKVFPAHFDLYSLGAVVVYLLFGPGTFDLDRPPAGWAGAGVVDTLTAARGVPGPVADFLRGLLSHRFPTAQDALAALAALRRTAPPAGYAAPLRVPDDDPPAAPDPTRYPVGTVVGGRYRLARFLAAGGAGLVYVAEDTRTGARVVVKAVNYGEDLPDPGTMKQYRKELVQEARYALRLQSWTGSVPLLLDALYTTHPDPRVAGHPDPDLAGPTEPVLVFELIAGRDLRDRSMTYDQEQLLGLVRALCGILDHLHRPDAAGGYHAYVDWKPQNVLRHPESGMITLIDPGGIIEVTGGTFEPGYCTLTPLYAGAEFAGQRRPAAYPAGRSFDLYGVAAVTWRVAAAYADFTLQVNDNELHKVAVREGAGFLKREVRHVPADYAELRPILEKALEPNPADRFQTARDMAAAATRGLGRLSQLPPESVAQLEAFAVARPGGCDVELKCLLPYDPFCEKLVVYRGDAPPGEDPGKLWKEEPLAGHAPGRPFTLRDAAVPDRWTAAHYAVVSVGFNGLRSAPRAVSTFLLTDPEQVKLDPAEGGLVLSWKVPDGVARNGGRVVLVREPDGAELPLAGRLATGYADSGLDPTAEYRYRVYSQLPYGRSPGVVVAGKPWPAFAQVKSVAAEPDDRKVRVRWTMTPGAATEVVFLRSQSPLSADEIDQAASRASFSPVRFRLDAGLKIVGADPTATLSLEADGLWHGEWVDTTAVPGIEYHYTPLFRFTDHARPHRWVAPAARAAAYAEAPRFDAAPLPGGVRLAWGLPDRAVRVRVTRAETADRPAASREFGPGQTAWIDRDPPPGGAEYECRVQVGPSWSRGLKRTVAPAAALAQLPPAPPPVPAVTGVSAAGGPGALELRWNAPAGARGVLLTLPQLGRGQFVAAGTREWKFDNLPPGPCPAEARVVGADHRLSPPARAEGVVT